VTKWTWRILLGILIGSPLFIGAGSEGFTLGEVAAVLSLIAVFFLWLFLSLSSSQDLRVKPVVLFVFAIFIAFALDFLKVIGLNYSLLAWLHWRQFIFLIAFFPLAKFLSEESNIVYLFTLLTVTNASISVLYLLEHFVIIGATVVDEVLYQMPTSPAYTLPFLLGFLLSSNNRYVQNRGRINIIYFISFIVMFFSVILDARRTPLILCILAAILQIVINIFMSRRIGRLSSTFIILFTVSVLYLSGVASMYAIRFDLNMLVRAYLTRAEAFAQAWNLFLDNWLLGSTHGGGFVVLSGKTWALEKVHSLYLYILYRGGLIVFLPFVTLFLYCLYKGLRVIFKNVKPSVKAFTEGSYIGIMCMLISGFTSVRMLQVEAWIIFALFAACIFHAPRNESNRVAFRIQKQTYIVPLA